MSNRLPNKHGLLRWSVPLLGLLVLAGALFAMFRSMRATIWSYYTDDATIEEGALTATPRQILWEEPQAALPAAAGSLGPQRPAFTPDGATMVFSARAESNTALFASTWDGRGWSKPLPLDVGGTGTNDKDPAISPDGQRLVFASDRPGGHGGYDIWIAQRTGTKWGAVTNAGPAINSANDDVAPAISPTGDRLLFASNREHGCFDIYAAAWPKLSSAYRQANLSSSGDDRGATFTPHGDFVYLDSNRQRGVGGADVYWSHVVRGEPTPAAGLGVEINSPASDVAPALRMEGFDLVFSSDRQTTGGDGYRLYAATAHEVVEKLDLSRVDLLLSRLSSVKWWILAFIAAILLLHYLLNHYRELTNLFHRCLMASAIIHVAALLLIATWKIGQKLTEKTVASLTNTVEVAIDLNALAREKLAADLAENVTGRRSSGGGGGGGDGTPMAPSEITVVARQADRFVPLPDFVPTKISPHVTTVARSTTAPVSLEDAPSRAQEAAAGGNAKGDIRGPVALSGAKLGALPEAIEPPRVDVVMESRSGETKTETKDTAFQPLLNAPTGLAARVQYTIGTGVVSSVSPVNIRPGVESVAVAGSAAGSGTLATATGTGTGDSLISTADTGGSFARPSRGGDESSGPRALSGLGDTVTARLANTGTGTGRGMGTGPGWGTGTGGGLGGGTGTGVGDGKGPGFGTGVGGGEGFGMLEVPEGFGQISPYQLRKDGAPPTKVVEELGGSKETETAVNNALEWLAQHQEPDGRWDIAKYGGERGHDSAATGLAALCFLGAGVRHNAPGHKYQAVLAKAIDWLVSQAKPDGDLRGAGTMYDQGIAAAALGEAYGLSKDEKLRSTVCNVADFIVKAQNKQTGGWRYKPGDEGDTSVFGWQVMALHSARLANVPVPAETYQLADKWLTSVGGGEHGGLYGYQNKHPKPAMAAEGMFCRQLLGASPDEARMQETITYLSQAMPGVKTTDFYYWYYGTLAMHQHQGPAWETWNRKLKTILLAAQAKEGDHLGSWEPTGQWSRQSGRVVSTAMSALMLEVYYRYLPLQVSPTPAAAKSAK